MWKSWQYGTWREKPKHQQFLFLMGGSLINETGRSQRHVQKGLQECLYINCCGISWPLVSYSINFLAMKTPGNTEQKHDDTEPTDEGDTQMKYSSH